MDTLSQSYLYWLDKLGWTTAEMLCVVTRGVSRRELPGGRDRPLEKFLSTGVKEGRLFHKRIGRRLAYTSSRDHATRPGNVYHDLMAAQSAVKLIHALKNKPLSMFSPSDFFTAGCPVIPDMAVSVRMESGVHTFAIEYQTYKEASRTTSTKAQDYFAHFGKIREVTQADFVWVLFVLERDDHWVGEYARQIPFAFVYAISSKSFFGAEAILTDPVFVSLRGDRVSLMD